MITYSDGVEEHRGGTLQDASELAAEHGLVMVPASGGWFQWVRDHGLVTPGSVVEARRDAGCMPSPHPASFGRRPGPRAV